MKAKQLIFLSFFFLLLAQNSFSRGREVTIFFKDGRQKSGELLTVRDSLISVLKYSVEKDVDIAAHPEIVEIAFLKHIDRVLLDKIDVEIVGVGTLTGAGLGAALGWNIVRNEEDMFGTKASGTEYTLAMAAGATAGVFAGIIISWGITQVMSENSETVRPSLTKGLSSIKGKSRFSNEEPTYVRDIIDSLIR